MSVRRLGSLVPLLMSLSAWAQALTVDNDLAACVVLADGQVVHRDNLLLYEVKLDVVDRIGACGCKSALAGYTVIQGGQVLRRESLVLKRPRHATLLLSPERALLPEGELTLSLGCAATD